jgi:DEAD/DEAH box helicase domain-containing protein
MHTTSYWLTLPRSTFESLPFSATERLNGLHGLAYAMVHISCVFLMCDRRDLGCAVDAGLEAVMFNPTIFIYDNFPGGIGLSRPLYEIRGEVLKETEHLIRSCSCNDGCPSCVGPAVGAKEAALAVLSCITHG